MIIVKLTILAILITVVYVWLFRAWLRTNPEEALKTDALRSTSANS